MRAAVFKKPFVLDIQELPLIKPGEKELRIQVEVCGICATDGHIYEGEAPANPPVVLGHEFVGRIIEKGARTDSFEVGDRVAIDPNMNCGNCFYCRRGQVHLCENLHALGVTRNGGFAEFSLVPISQVYRIPENFPATIAAFAEPLSCCLHGIQRAEIKLNEHVVIVGGGTIGLLMLQLAQLGGASKVVVMEPVKEKRDVARKLSATYSFDPDKPDSVQNCQDLIGGGADVVIECVGTAQAASLALQLVRRGGRVVLFGLADKNARLQLHLQEQFLREMTILWARLNPFTFQDAVDLLVAQKIVVEPFGPVPLSFSILASYFSQPADKSKIKYQFVQDH